MKYGLLVEKLNSLDEKFITSKDIKSYCSIIKMKYSDAIIYLTRHRHLVVLFKGIFYRPGIVERKNKSYDIGYREAIVKALEIKGVKNWYFGLETAIKLNNLTHEFFVIDYILNDTITRTKSLKVFGNKVKFIKVKPKLCKFGINKFKNLKFSDIEKTVLDMVYLKKYNGYDDVTIKDFIFPYLDYCSKEKLRKYAKRYNKKMESFVDVL
jgi:hypothetical protein